MNMFKNKPGSEGAESAQGGSTLIGSGTKITGDINATGDLRIDGTLLGNINGSAKVVIGSTGMVMGDIQCKNADIQGKVKGKLLVTDMLFLRGEAFIEGDIHAGKLQIESHATFNGHCHMGKDAQIVEMSPDEKRRTIGIR